MLKIKPSQTRTSRIDMLMASKTTRLEIYDAQIEALDTDYAMDVKLIKVEKSELLMVDNPHYDKIKSAFHHLIIELRDSTTLIKSLSCLFMSYWEVESMQE